MDKGGGETVKSAWLVIFKDGHKAIFTEEAYEKFVKNANRKEIEGMEHWFDMNKCIEKNSNIEVLIHVNQGGEKMEKESQILEKKIENVIFSYIDYVHDSLSKAKKGEQIDEAAIYCLGDAIRVLHHAKKILEKKEGLEKKAAELEGQVQAQPIAITVNLANIDDLEKLITEIKDKLSLLENFNIKVSIV
ncbi:hypothetical protein [Caloramator australicus]|uniref:hypothetical protein n=1 Tax=Caloramator australicus TaxID=515264 RepID=UPI00058ADD7A|nr:hypothetical protein [Caloramator australicus]